MARCTNLDQAVLGGSKLDKILPRILKKGDEEGKELAQKIFQNAAINSKQKYTDGKPPHVQAAKDKDGKHNASVKPSIDNTRVTNSIPGIKKSRGVDIPSVQPVKKATDTGHVLSGAGSAKSAGPFAKRPQVVKPELKAFSKSAPTITTLNQKKANHISAKPSGFFSSLQSASKKPGTSNAALLSAKSKEVKEK